MNFTHLHVHSHYSIYDGLAKIPQLVDRAIELGMNAIALTDHGNMYGIYEFFSYCVHLNFKRQEKGLPPFKAIRGSEVYYGQDAYHLVLLAKDMNGYENLCRIVSSGFEGKNFFKHKPHIDLELLRQCHEGIICLSACIGGEIPQYILAAQQENPENPDYGKAEEAVLRFREIFHDDFYIEIQRHETDKPKGDRNTYRLQQKANSVLIQLAKKHGIKLVATNDVHFVNEDEADLQDFKMCYVGNKSVNDPNRIHFTRQEWLKSPEEMAAIFSDIPEALANTQEIVDKVGFYCINDGGPLCPAFPLPEGYDTPTQYLTDLVFEGARERYGNPLPTEVTERIQKELRIISKKLCAEYFLAWWDIVRFVKENGTWVGPGRGAAPGSIVNYCLDITAVDPLRHGLLFERFFNEDSRFADIGVGMAHTDFDLALEHAKMKYGEACVSRIIAFHAASRYDDRLKQKIRRDFPGIPQKKAEKMIEQFDGTVVGAGVNFCGFVIAPEPMTEVVPTAVVQSEDGKCTVTQYNVWAITAMGFQKFDIVGMSFCDEIKKMLVQIQEKSGKAIDLSQIPLDDEQALQLFSDGTTADIMGFGSEQMREHLRSFHKVTFDDLVALVAIFRPGSCDWIEAYIACRNRGDEYPHIIFQEQMMEQSRQIAGFTEEQADKLRKALCGKQQEGLQPLHNEFLTGGLRNGCDIATLKSIWQEWEERGPHLFPKAHAASYAMIAYQCAYLKVRVKNWEIGTLYSEKM